MHHRSAPKYEYARIIANGSIRLILLQPSPRLEARVECSLVQATLEELDNDIVEHYVALSYVWGDENDRRAILIDGAQLDITASLESALRHIRDAKRIMKIWADGICIDQDDPADKNRQVPQMGLIYSRAKHTVIYIGESTPNRNAFMTFLREQKLTSEDLTHPPEHCLTTWFPPQVSTSQGLVAESHILDAPWFTRVWVLQELVLSSDPWLQCGLHRVRWAVFSSVILSAAPSSDPQTAGRVEVLRLMNEARSNFYKMRDRLHLTQPGSLLLELLLGRKGVGCSDPRDMIYAHLGMTDSATRAAIPVDYNKTVAEVYEAVARQYIEWKGNLSVLAYAEEVDLEQRRSGLPSWVPDWTIPQITRTEKHTISEQTRPHKHNETMGIFITTIPTILGVVGWSHGRVKTMIPNLQLPSDLPGIIQWLHKPSSRVLEILNVLVDYNLTIFQSFPLWRRDHLFSTGFQEAHIPRPPPILQKLVTAAKAKHGASELQMSARIMLNLHDLSLRFQRGERIAVLEDGVLAQVPQSTIIGDIIAHFHGGGDPLMTKHYILRPYARSGSDVEERTLLGLVNKQLHENGLPRITKVKQCQFVKIGGNLLYHGYEAALLKGSRPVMFAIY